MTIRVTPSLSCLRRCLVRFLAGVVLTVPQVFGQSADSGLAGLVQILKSTRDEAVQLDVLRGMKAALNGRRGVVMPPGWPAIERLLGCGNDPALVALPGEFGSEAVFYLVPKG